MKTVTRLALAAALLAASLAQAQMKPPAKAAETSPAPKAAQPTAPANAGAKSDPEMENAGRTAAHAWLLLLDRRDWGTAWDASSNMFRQSVPLGAWMDNIPKVRDTFGPIVEREPAEAIYKTLLPGRPDGHYVSVMFNSKFGKKARVQEIVTTVREDDGRWRVAGYTYTER